MYRIMLVDDEPSSIDTLRRVILKRSDDFTIAKESFSADAALALMIFTEPNVIFTDIKMLGTNGIEFVKKIAQSWPETVVIVVSGYDNFSFVHDAFVYGVEDYLLKPVSSEKFLATLDMLKTKLDNRSTVTNEKKSYADAFMHYGERSSALWAPKSMVDKIEEYVSDRIMENISITKICHTFAISQPYLSRIFRKYKNCTFNDFVVSLKLCKAAELLTKRQDLLIGTIATLSGFSDQFYFSRVFKESTGVTPSEFRRNIEVLDD